MEDDFGKYRWGSWWLPVILFMFLCPFLHYLQNSAILLSHLWFVSKEVELSEHSVNLIFSGLEWEHKIVIISDP